MLQPIQKYRIASSKRLSKTKCLPELLLYLLNIAIMLPIAPKIAWRSILINSGIISELFRLVIGCPFGTIQSPQFPCQPIPCFSLIKTQFESASLNYWDAKDFDQLKTLVVRIIFRPGEISFYYKLLLKRSIKGILKHLVTQSTQEFNDFHHSSHYVLLCDIYA